MCDGVREEMPLGLILVWDVTRALMLEQDTMQGNWWEPKDWKQGDKAKKSVQKCLEQSWTLLSCRTFWCVCSRGCCVSTSKD